MARFANSQWKRQLLEGGVDVVTGKLDVRQAAAYLTDEAETDAVEPELFDKFDLNIDEIDEADLKGEDLLHV